MDKNAEVDTCFRHRYCFAGRKYRWCSCKDEVIISGSRQKVTWPLTHCKVSSPGPKHTLISFHYRRNSLYECEAYYHPLLVQKKKAGRVGGGGGGGEGVRESLEYFSWQLAAMWLIL